MTNIELSCENLEKKFSNKTIFKGLNLTLKEKSSLVITGRNGSGKSTLLKVLANLIKENKGKVLLKIDGKDTERDSFYKHAGLLSPYLNLYDELTAFENLEFFYNLKYPKNTKLQMKERVNYLLERVNLFDRRNDLLKDFSSGMKQRLKLGFAVLSNPEILLMDEPRTNLDAAGIDIVYGFAEEQKQGGILIIATNEAEDTKLCEETLNIEDYK